MLRNSLSVLRRRSSSSSGPLKLHHRHLPGPADSPQPPLVLVHGLFGSGTNFQTVAKRLASRRHVYLPDLRNHGNSPWDDSFGVVDMAEDLVRMLDDANVEHAVLVGHSLGGKVREPRLTHFGHASPSLPTRHTWPILRARFFAPDSSRPILPARFFASNSSRPILSRPGCDGCGPSPP